MRKPLLSVVVLVLTSYLPAQTKPGAIGASGVWQPPQNFVSGVATACGSSSQGRKYFDCFVGQMAKAGAPADAVSFTRELYKENHGDVGVMTSFSHIGPIDIAWVLFPSHQPSNFGLFLVNGDPKFVNTEDLKQLDQKGMQQSFQFQDLQSLYPKVGLWPGNRNGRSWPNSQFSPGGGLQFVIGYPLRNGCATCSNEGAALFNWNFTSAGKFTGTSFLGLTPAPIAGSAPSQ
jgi:hypothetical protein